MTKSKAVKILKALIAINQGAIRRLERKRSYTDAEKTAAIAILIDDITALKMAVEKLRAS